MGEWAKGPTHAREAELLARRLGDERRLAQALSRHAMQAWMAGEPDRALELGQRALALAIAHDDVALQTSVTQRLGMVWQKGRISDRVAENLRRAVKALQSDRTARSDGDRHRASVFALDRLAWCLAELGEFGNATAGAEEAGRIAREMDHPRSLVFAYRSCGSCTAGPPQAGQSAPRALRGALSGHPGTAPPGRGGRAPRVRVRPGGPTP